MRASGVSEGLLLPRRRGRPTPWVIGIMMFVTLVVAAAGLAVAGSARLVARGAEHRHSVQLPGGSARGAEAMAAVRAVPGVTRVEAVPEAEVRRLLERWIGAEAAAGDLPVPALIEVELEPGTEIARLETSVRRAIPEARVLSYDERLSPVSRSLRALQWLALGLVLLMCLAMGAAVVLATRGAFDTHRSTIEVMHGIGATDGQLAGMFQRRIAWDALAGALVGAGAAALVLAALGTAPGSVANDLAGGPLLGAGDWLLLALLPLAATLMAMLVARATVIRALRATL